MLRCGLGGMGSPYSHCCITSVICTFLQVETFAHLSLSSSCVSLAMAWPILSLTCTRGSRWGKYRFCRGLTGAEYSMWPSYRCSIFSPNVFSCRESKCFQLHYNAFRMWFTKMLVLLSFWQQKNYAWWKLWSVTAISNHIHQKNGKLILWKSCHLIKIF